MLNIIKRIFHYVGKKRVNITAALFIEIVFYAYIFTPPRYSVRINTVTKRNVYKPLFHNAYADR